MDVEIVIRLKHFYAYSACFRQFLQITDPCVLCLYAHKLKKKMVGRGKILVV